MTDKNRLESIQKILDAVQRTETDGSERQVYGLSLADRDKSGLSIGKYQTDTKYHASFKADLEKYVGEPLESLFKNKKKLQALQSDPQWRAIVDKQDNVIEQGLRKDIDTISKELEGIKRIAPEDRPALTAQLLSWKNKVGNIDGTMASLKTGKMTVGYLKGQDIPDEVYRGNFGIILSTYKEAVDKGAPIPKTFDDAVTYTDKAIYDKSNGIINAYAKVANTFAGVPKSKEVLAPLQKTRGSRQSPLKKMWQSLFSK